MIEHPCPHYMRLRSLLAQALTQLTTAGDETHPAWSPDGSKIAFTSNRDGNLEIYVMNADGSGQANMTNTPGLFGEGVQEGAPAWSPDGSKIAFDRSSDSGNTFDIFVMNADGSGLTQLTTPGGYERHPAWSPDGSKIAYESYQPLDSGNFDIYVMNADGSGNTNLTDTPGVGDGVQELNPDWGVSAAPTTDTVTQEVVAGQTPTTVTTDAEEDGATPSDPVETNLTIPAGVGGTVSITETSTTQQAPAGFSFLDQQVEITAPAATPNIPLTLQLRIDSSKVPSGQTENDIEIFRNGVRVGDCTGAAATASPDPCVSGRQRLTDGDVLITALTSKASIWNFATAAEGQPLYTFKGFFQPVDNPPTINTVKGRQIGKAIPVTFSLGADKGLQIFSSGSPTSQSVNCGTQAPTDALEKTVNARSSNLSYNASTGRYTYLWKTDKAWVGSCRQLSVKLNDLTEHTALFKFR
jgi:WD40 repeat protein